MVGAGKLGGTVALAIERLGGHEVMITDVSSEVLDNFRKRSLPYREVMADELIKDHELLIGTIDDCVQFAELIFVAVQTPHGPEYEGVTRLPKTRADFDYRYLVEAMRKISNCVNRHRREVVVAIISTVLPGTIEREIKPWLSPYIHLAHTPHFIAMGTTIPDYMNPEFVLLGGDDETAHATLRKFYSTLHDAPLVEMSIASAELAKVYYNVLLGLKIVAANTLGEICEKTQADADDVVNALKLATDRLISPKYMTPGMGDAGGCHPRDAIALSALARRLGLSFDLFEAMLLQRELHSDWLADLLVEAMENTGFPAVILGKSYKPETNLTVGSAATLLANQLTERGIEFIHYDPHVDHGQCPDGPAVYFLATRHEAFKSYSFSPGSVVIDPWGFLEDQDGVYIKRIGRKSQGA